MTMFNKVTKQQGEWVTIEDMEFLEVDGKYIKKGDVGADWIEFNDQTTEMLMELVESVGRDDDVSFVLLEHVGNGAQVIGHKVSDRMMLEFIVALIESFIEDDPIKMVMLMMVLKDIMMEDE